MGEDADREARLAAAMRENLRRRKAQGRARTPPREAPRATGDAPREEGRDG